MSHSQQKRWWLNGGLLLIVAILGSAIWYTQQPKNENRLTHLSTNDITQITIQGVGIRDMSFNKEMDYWNISQPDWNMPASDFRIKDISKLAELPYAALYEASEVSLSDLKLEQGLIRVTLNNTEIVFGELNPLNKRRYLRIDERVFLTADDYFHVLRTEPASWLAANVIPTGNIINRISYDEHFTVLLENGTWSSNDTEVSSENIEQLVNNWQSAQAVWAKQSQAAESLGEITISIQNQKPVLFQILEIEPDLKLARPDMGVTYTLNADEVGKLLEIQTIEPASSALE